MKELNQEERMIKLIANIGVAIDESARELEGNLTTSEVISTLLKMAYGYNRNQLISELPQEEIILQSKINEIEVITENQENNEEKHL